MPDDRGAGRSGQEDGDRADDADGFEGHATAKGVDLYAGRGRLTQGAPESGIGRVMGGEAVDIVALDDKEHGSPVAVAHRPD